MWYLASTLRKDEIKPWYIQTKKKSSMYHALRRYKYYKNFQRSGLPSYSLEVRLFLVRGNKILWEVPIPQDVNVKPAKRCP